MRGNSEGGQVGTGAEWSTVAGRRMGEALSLWTVAGDGGVKRRLGGALRQGGARAGAGARVASSRPWRAATVERVLAIPARCGVGHSCRVLRRARCWLGVASGGR